MEDEPTPPPIRPKKDLVDASEDAIAEHQKAGDWDTDTVKQVRTAIRLFDYLLLTELPPPLRRQLRSFRGSALKPVAAIPRFP
ncbi:hypothetical protein [Sphingomonas sp. Leaf62]|uniref:hypothetical protein n=1 Tax=Sphingomonas sp. Leaf62 TaxID=1736228 RepID=UPI0006F4D51F|nr:hypothetical protein [Sphingomonas sp. Leaf62]KQN71894.1 hypothetical protein ASE91_04130 [Sphingomonas sp. Leaf62]